MNTHTHTHKTADASSIDRSVAKRLGSLLDYLGKEKKADSRLVPADKTKHYHKMALAGPLPPGTRHQKLDVGESERERESQLHAHMHPHCHNFHY